MTARPDPELLPERPAWNLATALALAAVAGVASLAWVSLLLAQLGRHALALVVALAAAAFCAVGAVLWRELARARTGGARPGADDPRAEGLLLALVAAVAAGAAWMFFPGFPFAVADRDPGVYLAQAFQIARTGDFAIADPVVDPGSGLAWADSFGWRQGERRFPGYWVQSRAEQRVVPQFYALYPSLLASVLAAAGPTAAAAVNPALATICVMLLFLIVRAAAGPLAGSLAALLFCTQMLEVWQAKYPTAEILAQLLLLGATLAFVVALERRSAALGALAGALATLTFLARPDGLLIVAACALAALAWAARGQPGAAGLGFLLGLFAPLPHALAQAYHPRLNLAYSQRAGLPDLGWVVLAAFVGLALLALFHRVRKRRHPAQPLSTAAGRRAATAVFGAFTVLLALGYLRPWIAGQHLSADATRSFNEESLIRLTWFFTPRGMLVLWLGAGLVCASSLRRRPAVWLLLVPTLVSLPVYLYDPRIDAGLMWWTRRFVPYTLPGMVGLVAIGLAGLGAWGARRPRRRYAVVALTAALAADLGASWLAMSVPLRRHHEMQGAMELIHALGTLAPGERAVLLWHSRRHVHSPGFSFGGPVWAYHGQVSALLPFDVSADELRHWSAAYPDSPVFLLVDDTPPPALASLPFVLFRRVEVSLPMWEESSVHRPARPGVRKFRFSIWRLQQERDAAPEVEPEGAPQSGSPPEPASVESVGGPAPGPRAGIQRNRNGAKTDSRTTPQDIFE